MTDIKWTYAIGDACWTHAGELDAEGRPKLTQGFVLAEFQPQTQPQPFYIIQLHDPDFPEFMCRDALLLSDHPAKPPAFMRMRMLQNGNTPPPLTVGGFNAVLPMGNPMPGGITTHDDGDDDEGLED